MPQYHFPGLVPGDRWCVTAINWLRAHEDGCAAPVVLASTHVGALEIVPLEALQLHAVDVPGDLSALDDCSALEASGFGVRHRPSRGAGARRPGASRACP